ncbi:hypothetical protein [Chryseobacterium caseinilyticum]|uniref:Carboxypeptidase-like regulatory domain-containing protein n=1 Tax=Chryseobacterium caseinilyticum TaxID=2771428 RepID=A0ABR8ZD42_9FLAO|nr:hypothetical protein [Chryseobacterium caseinilyticum]MBD8083176.1 hypothetical protein [Chryseobacterium caseinilyticum]
MKNLLFLFLIFSVSNITAQSFRTVSVLDSADSKPIANAKILTGSSVLYTNEDGKVLIPEQIKNIEISAPWYGQKKISALSSPIYLNPLFKEIEEVVVTNIDLKNLFKNIIDTYSTVYYSNPSLYTGTVKQKSFVDGKIAHLLVADVNVWSRFNYFNFNAGNDTDSFFNIGLNDIKFYKTIKLDEKYPFASVPNLLPKDFIGTFYMNYQIVGMLNTLKDLKIKTSLLYENAGIQKLRFESERNDQFEIKFTGFLTYNKNDRAIVNLNVVIDQNFAQSEKVSKTGEPYTSNTTKAEVFFDFYKRNNQYLPSLITVMGEGYSESKTMKVPFKAYQEIKLEKFSEGSKRGLKKKIDLSKSFIENIPDKDINETKTLLSAQEQKFIDAKS